MALRSAARGLATRLTRSTNGAPRLAEESELWISYTDPATLRKRLVGLAQQVRARMEEPRPELVVPHGNRVRHGFWFMRFRAEAEADEARDRLQGTSFESSCGTLRGSLRIDKGTKPLDVRAMLCCETQSPDPIENWLRVRFGEHGTVTSVRLPRLHHNWDGGMAFVRFADGEQAEAALQALDGTPSPIVGCNLFVDYAYTPPLYEVLPPPSDGRRAPEALE